MRKEVANRETFEPPVRPEWLALRQEAPLEPDLPIVDAHHHLWDHRGLGRYLFDDFRADLDCGHKIAATVFVQCRAMYRRDGPEALQPVGETEFVNGVAAMSASGLYGKTQVCAAIVGFADLRLGDKVSAVLEAHIGAGGGRFRGVRQISAYDRDPMTCLPANAAAPGLLADSKFREGFSRLAEHGLSFDTWLLSPQIDEFFALAKTFPETVVILDHAGTPLGVGAYATRQSDVYDAWRSALTKLAELPNVRVKLGGLTQRVTGARWIDRPAPPSSQELAAAWAPYVNVCIDLFSPQRCMFESNFPVDKASCSYGVFWNACKRLASRYDATEKAALLGGSAIATYRL